eukprot:6438755-Karenia_brevis.AAC.1
MQRRDPDHCVTHRDSNGRACPPQYTKEEWIAMRDRQQSSGERLVGTNTLNHTDGAPCYKHLRAGQLQDHVVHASRNGG